VHRNNILTYNWQDATLHSLFYLETALHFLSGTSTHHQERIQLYLHHLVFVTPLLLPAAIAVWQIPDPVDTVVCARDDGWWYHPKHVEHFPDINKPRNVASCWIYIGIKFHYLIYCRLNSITITTKLKKRTRALLYYACRQVPASKRSKFAS